LLAVASVAAEVSLTVVGGDKALETNLRANLRLLKEDCESPDWRVRRLFARAEADMQPALRALGYYRPDVQTRLQRDDDCWEAVIHVDPGTRTTIRRRDVVIRGEAERDEAFAATLAALPQAAGEPLDHAAYESIKSKLRSLAASRGYLDFTLTRQELRVFPDVAAAEIDIEADSGERYVFGEIRFGAHPLSEDLVHRLARVSPGDEFDSSTLIDIDRYLSDTGYFRQVEVRPNRAEASDGKVPIDVLIDPAKRHAWRAGVGFSTDTKWRISLGYDNRYLNEAGHRIESELRAGPVESGLKADYLVPGDDPHKENFSFGARVLHEESGDTVSDSVSLIARQIIKTGAWTQTRFIELLHERSEVGEDSSRDTLLMPGIAFDRVQTDDLLRPEKGYRLNVEFRGAHDDLLSTTTMLQFRGSAKGVYRFGDGGRVIARTRIAMTLGDEITSLPVSLRFFAGGDNSVRGYAYKSLGPENADGDVEGGLHLLTGSLEYEHPVYADDWWAAGFVDAGNAFDDRDFDLKVGYGGGIRWYSPIGRVRLDLAFPQDDPDNDWRIHFGLGAEL
jgi:translocation and assembly module TamA